MATMKVRVTVELTPEQVAWFFHEADCIGCTFQDALDIHCQEAMEELVARHSVPEGARMIDEIVGRATAN